jgi:hypothetical protein
MNLSQIVCAYTTLSSMFFFANYFQSGWTVYFEDSVRKRLSIKPEIALFLFINGTIPPSAEFIQTIYERYKDEDGFLYVTYSFENTFGKH